MKKSSGKIFGSKIRFSLIRISGFTFIELMVVLIIVAIFIAIAIPSYQQYMRKRDLAVAQQIALNMASELERFKSKNFSYKGFDASFFYPDYDKETGVLYIPIGSTASNAKYWLTLVDADISNPASDSKKPLTVVLDSDGKETTNSQSIRGLAWAMSVQRIKLGADPIAPTAQPKDPQGFDLLLRSNGLRCMTITNNTVTAYQGCGTDKKEW
ncbi:type IV pilin protein [Acinetobacter sp. Tr-809]|uniref:type IV pilin protein n=1 Tax=Acinetobacter sp. Tr-809 TaxID=2608324 RepID=UPI003A4C78A8